MWNADMLHGKAFIAEFNPLTHLIAIVRDPVLGVALATTDPSVPTRLTV